MENKQVVDWLLQEDQPSVRYYALTDLLEKKQDDPDVREAYSMIPRKGWAREILKLQKPKGYWEPREPSWRKDVLGWIEFLYRPKFVATNWRALVLADLGLTSKDKRIKKIADLFFDYKLRLGSSFNFFTEEACIVGNTSRMLTRFGYSDDYRVKKLYDRLLEDQREDGGWNCFRPDRGTLDNWERLTVPSPNKKGQERSSNPSQKEPSFISSVNCSKKEKASTRPGLDFTIQTTTITTF